MTALFVVLGTIAYFVFGAATLGVMRGIGSILENDDGQFLAVIFWPIVWVVASLIFLYRGTFQLARYIVTSKGEAAQPPPPPLPDPFDVPEKFVDPKDPI